MNEKVQQQYLRSLRRRMYDAINVMISSEIIERRDRHILALKVNKDSPQITCE